MVLLGYGLSLPLEVIPGEQGPFLPCPRAPEPSVASGTQSSAGIVFRIENMKAPWAVPRPDFAGLLPWLQAHPPRWSFSF